jgi:hypothetical protein
MNLESSAPRSDDALVNLAGDRCDHVAEAAPWVGT